MARKRGRPRRKKRQEIRINVRLRVDDDDLLRQFVEEILPQKGNNSDVVREALRLYVQYYNGDLTVDEPGLDETDIAVVPDNVNVEDIFGL